MATGTLSQSDGEGGEGTIMGSWRKGLKKRRPFFLGEGNNNNKRRALFPLLWSAGGCWVYFGRPELKRVRTKRVKELPSIVIHRGKEEGVSYTVGGRNQHLLMVR